MCPEWKSTAAVLKISSCWVWCGRGCSPQTHLIRPGRFLGFLKCSWTTLIHGTVCFMQPSPLRPEEDQGATVGSLGLIIVLLSLSLAFLLLTIMPPHSPRSSVSFVSSLSLSLLLLNKIHTVDFSTCSCLHFNLGRGISL